MPAQRKRNFEISQENQYRVRGVRERVTASQRAARAAYVALSRVRTLAGVVLTGLSMRSLMKTDRKVIEKYERLRALVQWKLVLVPDY